jgi:hypothetical protein
MADVSLAFIFEALFDAQPTAQALARRDSANVTRNQWIERRKQVMRYMMQRAVFPFGNQLLPGTNTQLPLSAECCASDHGFLWFVAFFLPMCSDVSLVLRMDDHGRMELVLLREFFHELERLKHAWLPEFTMTYAPLSLAKKKMESTSSSMVPLCVDRFLADVHSLLQRVLPNDLTEA